MFKKIFKAILNVMVISATSKTKVERLINAEIKNQWQKYNREFEGFDISFFVEEHLNDMFLGSFSASQKELAAKYGVPAMVLPVSLEKFIVGFSIDGIYKTIRNIPVPFIQNWIIKSFVMHEFVHIRQFAYLIKNGGQEALNKWAWYNTITPYFQNVAEIEAYMYQYMRVHPNIEKTMGRFLVKQNTK